MTSLSKARQVAHDVAQHNKEAAIIPYPARLPMSARALFLLAPSIGDQTTASNSSEDDFYIIMT